LAPSAANSFDAAPPMPVAPPEMIATLPASLPAMIVLLEMMRAESDRLGICHRQAKARNGAI